MTKLKISTIADDKPVKLTIELPAAVYRDLTAYAGLLTQPSESTKPIEPAKLIAPMLQRFMATDKAFAKARREIQSGQP
jgi:hypothetical protein